ncbi:MAG: bifunctional phosphoribosylaminoimidazolecarboxamide formyltransferase/IMP cyclohydrolase [Bdellovibrionota bacterium]|nr:bifunctional phosphoribosylaminoimidazolecarboxamide formyltransferase/IMP cyclohydrolase [Bdellovibrionota bacterium]
MNREVNEIDRKNLFLKRSLISVSDKSELGPLVKKLAEKGVELIASGGTARYIRSLGLKVTPLQEVTGNPEAFDGRMKSLSFQVSSSLLYRRYNPKDVAKALELGIKPIDCVICNLYPFEEASKGSNLSSLIENIDIGGPTMIRAAAKNYEHVLVCSSPSQYAEFTEVLSSEKPQVSLTLRKKWALDAVRLSASYEGLIASELENRWGEETKTMCLSPKHAKVLRYGENPHQKAWLYPAGNNGLSEAKLLQGKELSYNNILDADAAWAVVKDLNKLSLDSKFERRFSYSSVVVKHSNPCGLATASSKLESIKMSFKSDPISAFGSVIGVDYEVDEDVAIFLSKKFVELIVAPSFSEKALEVLRKKKNMRLLIQDLEYTDPMPSVRSVFGGWLVQDHDQTFETKGDFKTVTEKRMKEEQNNLISFGIVATKHLKSNAISFVLQKKEGLATIGAGMGNPNRFLSLKETFQKIKENGLQDLSEGILISDAFFPFRDSIDEAFRQGVKFIVQPGGSKKDNEVIEAANEHGIAMVMTGKRHFRH